MIKYILILGAIILSGYYGLQGYFYYFEYLPDKKYYDTSEALFVKKYKVVLHDQKRLPSNYIAKFDREITAWNVDDCETFAKLFNEAKFNHPDLICTILDDQNIALELPTVDVFNKIYENRAYSNK